MQQGGISSQDGSAPNRFFANVPANPGKLDAVAIDLAVKPDVPNLMRYTKEIKGITVADETLLIVMKIKSSTLRRLNQTQKLWGDLDDVLFCTLTAAQTGMKVPPELLETLDEDTMKGFWRHVHAERTRDYTTFQSFLQEIGVDIKESYLI